MSALAVIVVRDGLLPVGAPEVVAEAGGRVVVVGHDAEAALRSLSGVTRGRWAETDAGFRPAALARALADVVAGDTLVVLPASPDGRDLAPRLAAMTGRPLIARALTAGADEGGAVRAVVTRLDDGVLIPVDVAGPAVVTLAAGRRHTARTGVGDASPDATLEELILDFDGATAGTDPELVELLEPDLHTIDLADATRVVAGGAGLVAGLDDRRATGVFTLLGAVAAELGGSAGATRVATDAGWTGYERQIGTTGVTVDPDLYVALGVSGAAQHTGGLGAPRHVISVNTDPSCPMTAMSDLGLVTDARGFLDEVARRLGIDVAASAAVAPATTASPAAGSDRA